MKKLLCLFCAFALIACSKKYEPAQQHAGAHPAAAVAVSAPGAPALEAAEPGTKRYIASKHTIELSAPGAQLQQHFLAIQAQCLKLGCEILEATQIAEQPDGAPSASLTARVPPQSFDAFLAGAQVHAKMLSHHSESEDKTAEVINVEAKINNLEALRQRVAELLAKQTGNLKETLEAEKQLSETQAELDTINGLRRVLAKQTDMVRVEIKLVAQSLAAEHSFMAPLSEALKNAGSIFMSSLAALITVAVGAFPWLVVLVGVVYLVRRIRRGRAYKGANVKPVTQA